MRQDVTVDTAAPTPAAATAWWPMPRHVTSIAVHGALALLLLAFLPNRATRWHDLLPGALVATVGLVGLNVFAVVWLPHKLASLSETYGAIGVAVVTLGYLVLVGYLLVASILTNVMWHEYQLSR